MAHQHQEGTENEGKRLPLEQDTRPAGEPGLVRTPGAGDAEGDERQHQRTGQNGGNDQPDGEHIDEPAEDQHDRYEGE